MDRCQWIGIHFGLIIVKLTWASEAFAMGTCAHRVDVLPPGYRFDESTVPGVVPRFPRGRAFDPRRDLPVVEIARIEESHSGSHLSAERESEPSGSLVQPQLLAEVGAGVRAEGIVLELPRSGSQEVALSQQAVGEKGVGRLSERTHGCDAGEDRCTGVRFHGDLRAEEKVNRPSTLEPEVMVSVQDFAEIPKEALKAWVRSLTQVWSDSPASELLQPHSLSWLSEPIVGFSQKGSVLISDQRHLDENFDYWSEYRASVGPEVFRIVPLWRALEQARTHGMDSPFETELRVAEELSATPKSRVEQSGEIPRILLLLVDGLAQDGSEESRWAGEGFSTVLEHQLIRMEEKIGVMMIVLGEKSKSLEWTGRMREIAAKTSKFKLIAQGVEFSGLDSESLAQVIEIIRKEKNTWIHSGLN